MFWDTRRQEEKFEKPLKRSIETEPSQVIDKLDSITQQLGILSRYVSHLSRKVDQAIYITKIQEKELKAMQSKVEMINPSLERLVEKTAFGIEEEN